MEAQAIQPKVGMGVTCCYINDRYPYTIIEVKNNKEIVVQANSFRADKSKAPCMGHQNWIIDEEPTGEKITITLRKNGRWHTKGATMKEGRYFVLGIRDYYYCWEF